MITRLPPNTLFGFHHLPQEIWYKKNNERIMCDKNNGEDKNCSNSVPIWELNTEDHKNYIGQHIDEGKKFKCN
jgi:hypothetical protein